MLSVMRVVKTKSGQPIRAYKKFDGEVSAEMDRDDYIKALAEELGNPALVLTKKQMLEKLLAAADAVQLKMQSATAAVVAAVVM